MGRVRRRVFVAIALVAATGATMRLAGLRKQQTEPAAQVTADPNDETRAPTGAFAAQHHVTFRPLARSPAADADTEDMAAAKARQVIAKSRAAHATCATYEDEGTMDTAFRGEQGFTDQTVFHTMFAGPDAIRFAYRELANEYRPEDHLSQLVADDAGVVVSYGWAGDEPRREQSLSMAVAGMTGVSDGLVVTILPLLSSGLGQIKSVLDLSKPVASGTADVDGVACDVLTALGRDGKSHVTMWIGQADSLIRRISEDDVTSVEEMRKMDLAAAERARDAGLSVMDEVENRDTGLSTFSIVTLHPKCGGPIRAHAFRLTDGSL